MWNYCGVSLVDSGRLLFSLKFLYRFFFNILLNLHSYPKKDIVNIIFIKILILLSHCSPPHRLRLSWTNDMSATSPLILGLVGLRPIDTLNRSFDAYAWKLINFPLQVGVIFPSSLEIIYFTTFIFVGCLLF